MSAPFPGLRPRLRKAAHGLLAWRNALPRSWQSRIFQVPAGHAPSTPAYCGTHGYPCAVLYSGETSRRALPETPESEVHWKFLMELEHRHPDVFCAELPQAEVIGTGGAVVGRDRTLLLDVSQQFGLCRPDDHDIFTHYLINPRTRTYRASLAVIATSAEQAYFHWLTDVLPRFHILEAAGALPVAGWIVNALSFPAAVEMLALLGIPSSKIIETRYWTRIRAERLVVPSLPGVTGNPAAWVCGYLRRLCLPRADALSGRSDRRIYISRGGRRRIANEAQLLPVLEKFRFTVIRPERMRLLEQVRVFSRAEAIVAPHGAALANLVFCQPGAKVVELFSPSYVNVCFWAIANQAGLRYSYLEGEGDRPRRGTDPQRCAEDMIVDPGRLESWLGRWL